MHIQELLLVEVCLCNSWVSTLHSLCGLLLASPSLQKLTATFLENQGFGAAHLAVCCTVQIEVHVHVVLYTSWMSS